MSDTKKPWDFPVRKNRAPFKKLDLIQGTPEWLEARYDYVTASQAPVLLNLSPHQTPVDLFEEKILRRPTQDNRGKDFIFAKGHSAEAAARAYLKEHMGLDFEQVVLVSTEFPILMASLDGYSARDNIIFEGKLVGAGKLEAIRKGILPPDHLCQIQDELLVSGADLCLYFPTSPKGDSHVVEIKPDPQYQEEIVLAAERFMAMVNRGEQPAYGERDFVEVDDVDGNFGKFVELDRQLKIISAQHSAQKAALNAQYGDIRRLRCGNVSITTSVYPGPIDLEKVPVLRGIDLEKYRGPSTERRTVKVAQPRKKKTEGEVA